MDFTIPEELKMFQAMVRDFIKDELYPLENQYLECDELPEEVCAPIRRKAIDLGLWALNVPEEYGGEQIGELGHCLFVEERGRVAVGQEVFGTGVNNILLTTGTPAQKERWVIPTVKGEMQGCWALTEPGAGSDAAGIATTAVWDGKNYIVNGSKCFTAASQADYAVVVTRLKGTKRQEGITIFVVPKGHPGYRVVREIPLMAHSLYDPRPKCEVAFEDCVLPPEYVLGEPGQGWQLMQSRLGTTRLRLGALAVGVAERCLQMAIDYSKQRTTFGTPLSKRQAIQWMLADSATEIHATRLMVYHAAWKVDQGEDARQEFSFVKLYSADMVGRVVDRCLQIHGGLGFSKDMVFERYYRSVRCLRIIDGTPEIQRFIIARNLLRD
jgi:acyl-CoA dehydrogenase